MRFPDPAIRPVEPPAVTLEAVVLYLHHHDTACSRCNYNLRGGISSACPECGAPVLSMFRWVPVRFASDAERLGHLTSHFSGRDARCPRCRASLRDHNELMCPSCELPLALWILRLATADFRDPSVSGTPLTIWIPKVDGLPDIPRTPGFGPFVALVIAVFWVVMFFVFVGVIR